MEHIIKKMQDKGLLDDLTAERVRNNISDGTELDLALLNLSGLPEEEVLRFLAEEFQYPFMSLDQYNPSKDFLSQFPARILMNRKVLPMEGENGTMIVASSRIFDTSGVDELRLATGKDFRLVLAPSSEIDRCIKQFLGVGADTVESMVTEAEEEGFQIIDQEMDDDMDLADAAQGASIIKFVNQVITEAIQLRATDVHIEPFENELKIRYRIDGVLKEVLIPPEVRQFQAAIVSRLKILSHLDIAEKRLPQDGRIKVKISQREVDVRVSVIPMLHGEAIVLRLLDRSSVMFGMGQLGMSEKDRETLNGLLEIPHGIILVTGPTGSGKTTTLYAALSKINSVERKIITIEDPVEYQLRGVNQIQVSRKAGLTFARGLRSILRHDPDVILIGEIRDVETAEIAVQASLTGHLVFSTLHTNDAPGALTRLVDMGVEPYLVASTLEASIAQRLVRVICPDCKEEFTSVKLEALQSELNGRIPKKLFRGRGCKKCQNIGYLGRIGVFEQMVLTEAIRSALTENESPRKIRALAVENGMNSLREDGFRYLEQGITTVEELLRVTKDER
ncbi:MAG: Flp pilus assembly complex ATPase component TadA [Deltaproteobacteria bacterium]|nr:Flp pilus assembly complex ATPase component TadA [Deltaproteobacteria bacterium]